MLDLHEPDEVNSGFTSISVFVGTKLKQGLEGVDDSVLGINLFVGLSESSLWRILVGFTVGFGAPL